GDGGRFLAGSAGRAGMRPAARWGSLPLALPSHSAIMKGRETLRRDPRHRKESPMKKRMLRLTLTLCLALSLLTGTASAAATPTFADVQEGDWYVEDVAYVYEHGLKDGTAAYTFSPNGKATRAMVITILYRLAGQPASSGDSPFQDVRPSDWFSPAVAWAVTHGIANGTSAT